MIQTPTLGFTQTPAIDDFQSVEGIGSPAAAAGGSSHPAAAANDPSMLEKGVATARQPLTKPCDADAGTPNVVREPRPVVKVHPGSMHVTYAEAEKHLAAMGPYFERSGQIVRVKIDSLTGEASVVEIDPIELSRVLDEVSAWQRFNKRVNDWVPTDPPQRVCTVLARNCSTDWLRPLAGLVRQPYLRADGSLVTRPGYDSNTRLYGAFSEGEFSDVDAPTPEDAYAALGVLDELLDEFPFATDHDRSAALSAMLTAAIRPSLPLAPMFHVRAHAPGTGKSYLCSVIASLATPRAPAPLSFPSSNDECDKVLLAELARSPGVIVFDNLTTDIVPFKKLCSTLTEEEISGRVLGASKMLAVSTRAMILSSGNNVGAVADMPRRCVTINLDAKEELPATRRFTRPDLLDDLRRDRSQYVRAAITIVKAWMHAGSPRADVLPLGSFGAWSDRCRQSLLWLGLQDPAQSVFTAMEQDPDRERLRLLLDAWTDKFAAAPVRVRDLITWARGLEPECGEIKELLVEAAGERDTINNRRLGWWLKRHVGQVAGGLRIERAARKGNVEAWSVTKV